MSNQVALAGPARRDLVARLPSAPGVYRFRNDRGTVLYVGRAANLRERVASYWSDLGDRAHLARMVARIVRIEAVACDSPHEAAWLERNLLEVAMPRWNRVPGGMEVPVWIRLDERPRAPGLSLVHLVELRAGWRDFGPYLGGNRVRLALAALHRILPLAYTGTGMTGAEADMGRQRGVTAADRPWLVDATAAVLGRNADAIGRARTALDELRDRAAVALAFERAQQIQSERHGLDWVTSPQRVTAEGGTDADVYGWSGGLLLHFAIRDGRLCAWSQHACSEEVGARHAATTPPAWAEFARRNAELAAALASAPAPSAA